MQLPFLPFGAILAFAVLGGAFAIFGAVLRLVDRAALSTRTALAPTVIHGFRTWSHQPDSARPPSAHAAEADVWSSPRSPEERSAAADAVTFDELDAPTAIATERVRRH